METIQIVIDTPLRKEADRLAKKSKVNRSELFRELLRAHLKQIRIREMEEREIRAYEKMPDTLDDWRPWEAEAAWPDE
jgi:metal-responsive CopG/Arc/MetJ family transcriptional regulator